MKLSKPLKSLFSITKLFLSRLLSRKKSGEEEAIAAFIKSEIDSRTKQFVDIEPKISEVKTFSLFKKRTKLPFDELNSENFGKVIKPLPQIEDLNNRSPLSVTDFFSVKPGSLLSPISFSLSSQPNSKLNQSQSVFIHTSPYRYSRLELYYKVESYFSRSIGRQIETTLRNGFFFVSDNSKVGSLIKKIINNLRGEQRLNLTTLLTRVIYDLLMAGFFVIKKEFKTVNGKKTLSKLTVIEPSRLSFVTNELYELTHIYIPTLIGAATNMESNIYPISDFIVGFFNDPCSAVYPVPPCLQVIDDILSLRSIEETIELLAHQYGSPLLHAKIGTDNLPCGKDEPEKVARQISNMAPNGVIATDHRVEIISVRLQTAISNMIPYLEHFKDRIFIGTGTSGVLVGEGNTANRATSESHDNSLADRCVYIGDIIEEAITYQLIRDILTYSNIPFLNEDGDPVVTFEFNEVTLSKVIEKSNLLLSQFEGNLISRKEARKGIKRYPLTEEELDDMFLQLVQLPLAKSKLNQDEGQSLNPTAIAPMNQYGKKMSPGSRKD